MGSSSSIARFDVDGSQGLCDGSAGIALLVRRTQFGGVLDGRFDQLATGLVLTRLDQHRPSAGHGHGALGLVVPFLSPRCRRFGEESSLLSIGNKESFGEPQHRVMVGLAVLGEQRERARGVGLGQGLGRGRRVRPRRAGLPARPTTSALDRDRSSPSV